MQSILRISVFGGGSWATAIIKILESNPLPKDKINWYIRKDTTIEHIRSTGRNPKYLSSVKIDNEKINLSSHINEVISNSDVLIFAIPSAYLPLAANKIKVDISKKFILSSIKGIVPEKNLIVSHYFNQEFGVPLENIGTLSGPCHAEEIALEKLSYLTISSKNLEIARKISELIECRFLRTSTSSDTQGTEYAAVLKNIYAIATGICHGLGYGDNFQAILISNALQELKRFINEVDTNKRDIKESSYLGDLLVTNYSTFSRNRSLGTMIGKGYSVKSSLLDLGMVSEGYFASKCIKEINEKYKVHMPIAEAVYNILYENVLPAVEIKLLTNNLK